MILPMIFPNISLNFFQLNYGRFQRGGGIRCPPPPRKLSKIRPTEIGLRQIMGLDQFGRQNLLKIVALNHIPLCGENGISLQFACTDKSSRVFRMGLVEKKFWFAGKMTSRGFPGTKLLKTNSFCFKNTRHYAKMRQIFFTNRKVCESNVPKIWQIFSPSVL